MLLDGKAALVTGGASGIGRAIALAYAREGAKVVVADINDAGGRETVALIEAIGATAMYHRIDVTRPDEHIALIAAASWAFGVLNVVCNNAGIARAGDSDHPPLADVGIEEWERVIAVNMSAVFYGMRAQIPALLAAGGGSIVNISSVMGQVAAPGLSPYVASKHGVLGLTRAAAIDYAAHGVRINAVGPGYIDTPLLSGLDEAARKSVAAQLPIGRLGRPAEIAEMVVWLSSDRASFATGGYYPVDGGYLAL